MYDLPYFKENDPKEIRKLIDHNPFAFLTGCDVENKPVATQIPLFMEENDGKQILRGHIMKNTDHHLAFLHNPNVLAVFTGSHAYVSATWYTNPHTASTWNYMSVHAKGIIRFLDEEALEDLLRKTSLHFENYNHHSPTSYDNIPEAHRKPMLKEIVAFEIRITHLDNVFKLSQNRNEKSYENIMNALNEKDENAQAIALEMEKRKRDLFD
jgi:transcriptional regulator